MKRSKPIIRKWYRYEFVDGTFIYLSKSLRSLKQVYREKKIHGKIVSKIEVGGRAI